MEYIPQEDLNYLNHKYHNPEGPFDPFKRYLFHGYEYPDTGFDDERMRQELEALYGQIKTQPHPAIKAQCFAFVLDHMRIDVSGHDYFVGLYNWGRPMNFIQQKWKAEAILGDSRLSRLHSDLTKSGALHSWPDFDHVIPDWDSLMRLGFPGLLARVRHYRHQHLEGEGLTEEQQAFFDGMETEFSAILRLLDRLREYALANPTEKSERIAKCLLSLRQGAPKTTYEALMAIYLFFMLCEHVDNYQTRSMGNGLDRTLYPFYRKDLESGMSREELETYIAYFLMQYAAIGNYWGHPLYLGGTDEQGNTRVNEASYSILRVHEALGIYNPKIQIKVNRNTPVEFLNMAFRRVRKGSGSFVFCCEPGHIEAVKSYATEAEAADFELSGCYETRVRALESVPVVGHVNAVKAVLLALEDGFDSVLGKQIGPRTGDAACFDTFEKLHAAFLTQWDYLTDSAISIGNELYDPNLAKVNPSLMYTATNELSLQKGKDGYVYGCKYNNSSLANCGFADAVDSMMAIRELVYEKKTVTLAEYRQALAANWAGYERLRMKARNSRHKYGNNDPEADAYAAELANRFADRVNGHPNGRGGIYKSYMHAARQFIVHGKILGATPDGRLAGEELSKNASPCVGMDRNGVTALIKSALALKPSQYHESFCVDLMLHPSAVEGDEGLAVMKALLDTYLENGGMSMQFNVFSSEQLRDAQAHPEKYQNLQVRVCGWNVLWNNMCKEEQDAYILRSESIC